MFLKIRKTEITENYVRNSLTSNEKKQFLAKINQSYPLRELKTAEICMKDFYLAN